MLATGRTFPSGTASGFLGDAKKIGAATPAPEGLKSAVSSMTGPGRSRRTEGWRRSLLPSALRSLA